MVFLTLLYFGLRGTSLTATLLEKIVLVLALLTRSCLGERASGCYPLRSAQLDVLGLFFGSTLNARLLQESALGHHRVQYRAIERGFARRYDHGNVSVLGKSC